MAGQRRAIVFMLGTQGVALRRTRLRCLPTLVLTTGLVLATTAGPRACQAEPGKNEAVSPVRIDLYGDPLPPGAIARMGTTRDLIVGPSADIVLSPDGKSITATTHGWWTIPLRLWDVDTGRVRLHLKELEAPAPFASVRQVAFSPDGKLLAAGDSAGIVRIGTTDVGRKVRQLAGPDSVECLAFLPDGKHIAVGYNDGSIWVYALATGHRIRSLTTAPVYGLMTNAFSPDGKFASIRRWDASLSIREVVNGREIHRLFLQPGRAPAPAWGRLAVRIDCLRRDTACVLAGR